MEKSAVILAIESSCDETGVAIVKDGNVVLANVVASQIESHKRFGGVVPEVASRHHVEDITLVVEDALKAANLTWHQIDAIAVTEGPGLVGSLLIGINAAKALAFAHQLPLLGIHHIAGHIYANQLVEPLKFPLLALVVSGGHTELIYMKGHYQFEKIGETLDDAVGEAYDKVARVLNLPYPGGPHLDALAQRGKDTYQLPRVWLDKNGYDFSFSGLKSAVINTVHNKKQRGEAIVPENLAASFQESVIEVLVGKTIQAARQYKVGQLLVAGGVSANKGLREALNLAAAQVSGLVLTIPPLAYCTDNAAMIGAAAYEAFKRGYRSDLSMNGRPGMELKSLDHQYEQAWLDYLIEFHYKRDYFECHEILEERWKEDPKEKRSLYWVALIQVAVGMYHYRRDNLSGAAKLLSGALRKSESCLPELKALGLEMDPYLSLLKGQLERIKAGLPYESIDLPVTDEVKTACLKQVETFSRPSDLENAAVVNRHLKPYR